MHCRAASIILLTCLLLAACSSPAPTWRSRVMVLVADLGRHDASKFFPHEYRNLLETFEHGEAVLHVNEDDEEADSYYLLALQKGELLRAELRLARERKAKEERIRKAEEKARIEEERLLKDAIMAEERLRVQEHSKKVADESRSGSTRGWNQTKDQAAFPVTYTVRRGETLPQIAARSEIYNDATLWPIIYRVNRDQIRDPKQLWPGQSLKIPRNFSRDEANEAKRYSVKK